MPVDEEASNLAAANKMVVDDFENFMKQMIKDCTPVPPAAARAILEKLKKSQKLTDFYNKLNEKIVQADFSFSGTIVQGTSINRVGNKWRLEFTIDADVPPPGSRQKPHIGYEISVNGRKKQVGHKFLNGLTIGRPEPGTALVKANEEHSTETFPNGDKMEWSFVCWRLP